MQTFTKNYVELDIEITELQICTITVQYIRVGTAVTLAPRPFPNPSSNPSPKHSGAQHFAQDAVPS